MSWKKRTYILKKREDRLLGKSSECDTKKKKRISKRKVEVKVWGNKCEKKKRIMWEKLRRWKFRKTDIKGAV